MLCAPAGRHGYPDSQRDKFWADRAGLQATESISSERDEKPVENFLLSDFYSRVETYMLSGNRKAEATVIIKERHEGDLGQGRRPRGGEPWSDSGCHAEAKPGECSGRWNDWRDIKKRVRGLSDNNGGTVDRENSSRSQQGRASA